MRLDRSSAIRSSEDVVVNYVGKNVVAIADGVMVKLGNDGVFVVFEFEKRRTFRKAFATVPVMRKK